MLLVRPDGIEAYYVALEALQYWGSSYGYEFVDSNWNLEFGDPDPKLARQLQEAVEAARVLQLRMLAATPRGTSRRENKRPRTFRVSQGRGGLVSVDDGGGPNTMTDADTDWGEKTDWSAGGANPTPGGSGDGSVADDAGGGSKSNTFARPDGPASFSPSSHGYGGSGRYATNGYRDGVDREEGSAALSASGGSGQGFEAEAGQDARGSSVFGGGSASARKNPLGSQFAGGARGTQSRRAGLGGRSAQPAGNRSFSELPGGGVYSNIQSGGNERGANERGGGYTNVQQRGSGALRGGADSRQISGAGKRPGGDSLTGVNGAGEQDGDNSANPAGDAPTDPRGAVAGGASTQRGPAGKGPQQQFGKPATTEATGAAAGANSASSISVSGAKSSSSLGGLGGGPSLAQQRGQNWAVPKGQPGAVPITRPIRIRIDGDRLTMMSEDRGAGRAP